MLTKCENRTQVELTNRGQKIFGILHLPLERSLCPAIVMCHGLAGNKTGRARQYVTLSERLAEVGIASLRIDFRGSGDSEGDLSDITLQDEVSDTLLALNFLSHHPNIDKSKIGIFGRSLGGLVAIMSATRFGSIKSIVTWSALFDGHQWEEVRQKWLKMGLNPAERSKVTTFNGQKPNDQFFKELFLADAASELKQLETVPLLNIHGESDPVVALEHFHRYRSARKHLKDISEFIALPTDEHEFVTDPYKDIAIDKTVRWFFSTLS